MVDDEAQAISDELIGEDQPESVLDDHQSIDLDINTLAKKFIWCIDRYRSHNSPIVTGLLNQPGLVSHDRVQESRTHAFYRMLGLPIIAPSGKFFSPGFNPLLDSKERARQANILAEIPLNIRQQAQDRETLSRYNYDLFSNASSSAVIFALSMSLREGQRLFSNTSCSIPIREQYLRSNFKLRSGAELSFFNKEVSHLLAPFTTDAIIAANLDPNSGSLSVVIGAPFLEKEDLEYERNKYLKRPGLEFILRLRLRQQNVALQTGIAIDNIDLSNFTSELSIDRQRDIAATLTGIGTNEADVNQALKGSGRIELYTLDNLVKTYKGLINLYVKALEVIENVNKEISWIPLPNDGGPERGSEVSTAFIIPKQIRDSWELQTNITKLEIKSALANMQLEIGETADETPLAFNDFAISEFQNVANSYSKQLQEYENTRAELETKASNALRTIELIGGEVSGLGIIDVVAIYMALWSLDVNVLLDLIDDGAAQRLNQIPELQTGGTADRAARKGNATEAYNKLAERIRIILSYGDSLFIREQSSLREEGGDIPRD